MSEFAQTVASEGGARNVYIELWSRARISHSNRFCVCKKKNPIEGQFHYLTVNSFFVRGNYGYAGYVWSNVQHISILRFMCVHVTLSTSSWSDISLPGRREKGKGKGNLGAQGERGRKERNAWKENIVFFIFLACVNWPRTGELPEVDGGEPMAENILKTVVAFIDRYGFWVVRNQTRHLLSLKLFSYNNDRCNSRDRILSSTFLANKVFSPHIYYLYKQNIFIRKRLTY